jgi:hypothetical protein
MAPPKQTYKTEEAAKASNNSLLKQFFKSTKKGRPKKADGDTTVVTRKKKPGPVPHPNSKKPPPKPAPSEAKKRASAKDPEGEYYKVKKRRTNWGEGVAKEKLDAAIKE